MLINAIKKSQDFVSLKEEVEKGKLGKTLLFISKDSLYAEEFCKQVASLIFDGQDLEASENSMKVNANAHPVCLFLTVKRLCRSALLSLYLQTKKCLSSETLMRQWKLLKTNF